MNLTYQSRLIAKAVSLLGATAFVALISLPGLAQSTRPSQGVTTPRIGPSETPTGSPSVPGNSSVDDPGRATDGSSMNRPGMSQNGSSMGSSTERDGMQNNSLENQGPSTAPTEAIPGPSETPSGSPSVPGTSGADDPGNSRLSPGPSRDAMNNSDSRDNSRNMDNMRMQNGLENQGPSTAPTEAIPGPSETPSGSPSVPGTSGVDDPGAQRK